MNIKKINLIVGREFTIRVRKKSFLIATFLTPLLMAAFFDHGANPDDYIERQQRKKHRSH